MRLQTCALALGAASTAAGVQDQKVLNGGHGSGKSILDQVLDIDFDAWAKPLEKTFGHISSEAKGLWQEVAELAPEAVKTFKSQMTPLPPKKHSRKPDSAWDHVVKGADVQDIWVKGDDGEDKRKVGGRMENYSLRAKKVDTSKLGVDTVKQFSGYLDDDEKDKHLFYCKGVPFLNKLLLHITSKLT